jgi:serine/threonine-protein kinase
MAIGTAAYMSPEQASAASHIDGRSDVYSLGCVVYEMLAGEPPYTGPTAQAIIAKRFSDPVPSVRRVRPSVPANVDRSVIRALAPVPADRFGTMAELAEALVAPTASPSTTATTSAVPARARAARPRWRTLTAIGAATIGVVVIIIAALLMKQRTPSGALDPNVVAVAPFRVTSADPALGYLREGMVDLLAAKLTGQVGPRAADPRSVLSGWRGASRSDAGELPPEAALRIAERLGAGQLLLGNVVGAPGRVALHASVLAVPGGQAKAQASVEGPTDSLPVLVDQLAAQLLTLDAGEGEQRLASLTSTSLPALRGYLEGQALYRRGRYGDAAIQFGHALDLDSTFALAALGLLASGNRTGAFETVSRGQDLVWAARERLTPRDKAYMTALIGSSYSDTTSYSAILSAAEQFVRVAPDRAEAWTTLGDALNNFGELLGLSDATGRGASAYRRALELDPSFVPALEGVVMMAARSGDTATVRRLGGRYLSEDSAGAVSVPVRWRTAVALADTATLERVRAGFGAISQEDLGAIGQLSQYDGVALEDAQRATALLLKGESRSRYRLAVLAEVAALALNRGRPAAALQVRQEQQTLLRGRSNIALVLQIMDALYWEGDTTAGAVAARKLGEITARLPTDTYKRHLYSCALEQWRLVHGQLATVRRSIAEMRSPEVAADYKPSGRAIVRGCAILLDALLAAAEHRKDAGVYRERLDSLMLTGPSYRNDDQSWNLVVARLKEAAGDRQGALAATRRRLYFAAEPLYLSTYLHEEGRLAELTGDRAGAIRAYQHYLVLRADPEPALRPRVEQVRAQLAQLLNEPAQ